MTASFWQKVKTDPVYRQGLIFMIGNFTAAVMGYLYHLFMGRLLAPAEYAIVASLLSLFIIISVPANTIQTVVMRYTAQYQAQRNIQGINWLERFLGLRMFWAGCVVAAVFLALSPWISRFLNIGSVYPVAIVGLVFIFSFLSPVYRGILQGLQKFKDVCWSLIGEALVKLGAAVALVWLGFQAGGAVAAVVLGVVAGLLIAWQLTKRRERVAGEQPTRIKELFAYTVPVVITLLILALLYNIDVILVKHYFPGDEAGHYAALSQLGKIIVFGTGAIAGVMFPMVVEKFEKKQNYAPVLWKSIGIVGLLSGIATVVYFLAPKFIIGLLYGPEYLALSDLLGYVAIFMTLYAVLNILIQFFISIKSYRFLIWLGLGIVAQVLLIIFYHRTISQVIIVMDLSLAAITALLFIYYAIFRKKLGARQTVDSGTGL